MARVYISKNDTMHYYIYTEEYCNDVFGDDFIIDYGKDIPDELLERYQKAYKEFWAIQEQIKAFFKA